MAQLPTRQLGKDGPHVTALGFGAMGMSAGYGTTEPDEERFKVLDRCFELGCRNWDTADVYMDSEDLIGKWFQRTGKRNEVFIATKFGIAWQDGFIVRSDPEHIRQACEKSLKRLGTDYIDLYYMHRTDKKTPIEETVQAMAELKKEGKIKYLGLSEVSSETLRRACAVHHISALQVEFSPFALDIKSPQIGILDTCRELGVAVIAYSPLGRGFITGQYRSRDDFEKGDFRLDVPRYSPENFPKNLQLVDQFGALAKEKGCTPGQLCLAWLLSQGKDIIPIPGTKKIKYLEENLAALKVELTDEENAEISRAVEAVEVHGERYPPSMVGSLFGDTPPLASKA
ncbi:MAG: hypothetical protein M1839_003550 [Geoglossum umbratile]|nr:MAG: hypothetical protein M1839_003550 [Geoglossum umbratile]